MLSVAAVIASAVREERPVDVLRAKVAEIRRARHDTRVGMTA